jgi:hypothetical protein
MKVAYYVLPGGEERHGEVDEDALRAARGVLDTYGGDAGPKPLTALAAAIAEYQRRAGLVPTLRPREADTSRERVAGRIPPLVVCPYCQPGPISYAGVVVSRVCGPCRLQGLTQPLAGHAGMVWR